MTTERVSDDPYASLKVFACKGRRGGGGGEGEHPGRVEASADTAHFTHPPMIDIAGNRGFVSLIRDSLDENRRMAFDYFGYADPDRQRPDIPAL